MNKKWNTTYLPVLILGCGGVSGALWALMQRFCQDEKGLLNPWNVPGILLLLITLAVSVAVILLTRPLGGSNRYGDNFGPSLPGAVTTFAAAAGILLLVLGDLRSQQDILSIAWLVLGLLSVPSLILTGLCRLKGKRPHFLLHAILCLFFGIHMANQYRLWSSNPELPDYSYQLFACVGLALTAYCHTAFDVGMGRRLRMLPIGLLTAYFCLVCICVEGYGLFYLTCGLWAAANLCAVQPKPRRPRPDPQPAAPGEESPAPAEAPSAVEEPSATEEDPS